MVQEPESCRKVVCGKDVMWMLDGQNLPVISKVMDVPYRTLWGSINESEEYDGSSWAEGNNLQNTL